MNRFLLTLPLAAALAACGGGGGDDTPVTQPANPATPTTEGIISNIAVSTHTRGSEELAAFTMLNEQRASCGFGKLAQNAQLDATARGMADWIAYNKIPGHIQAVGTPLFTGVTAEDRAVAAGYNPRGSFTMQDESTFNMGTFGNDKAGFGAQSVRRLLNAPYHAVGLLDGYREVGISIRNAFDAGAPDAGALNQGRKSMVINPARLLSSGSQLAALGTLDVLTYPCNGTTNVEPGLYNEEPNPVPGRDLLNNPLGSSVQIAIKEGHTLTISSASMRVTGTGAAVALRTPITSANDPHVYGFASHRGYIIADAPLAANTTYSVEIVGTNNGARFTQAFNFTTGVQAPF